ncbi:hypothetical protein DE146DRAFT_781561 [Phaeosphaeria sp. MPI-PUGE-AT-0046c]|nr:hypothetical protein DE146DRAFT_781561 [Phaeosphaeria sp. MPI-PUGE-AT-0046c]
MGLSPLLVDKYRRYKRNTKKVTQWLGTTARATGLVNDIFEKDLVDRFTHTRHINGKNHEKRRQEGLYMITVPMHIRLAEAVKKAGAPCVPHHLLRTLNGVIADRKECASCYRNNTTEESDDNIKQHNEGHQYIIEVFS